MDCIQPYMHGEGGELVVELLREFARVVGRLIVELDVAQLAKTCSNPFFKK